MNLASVTFTTPKNFKFLKAVSPSWVQTSKSFAVLDQEHSECALDGFELVYSNFERGTTLDGKSAVVGVLLTLREIAFRFPDIDYFLKIDDDMLQMNSCFMKLIESDMFHSIGQEIIRNFKDSKDEGKTFAQTRYAMGGAYILSSEILKRLPGDVDEILELLDIANSTVRGVLSMNRPNGYTWPEDESIGTLINSICKPEELAWVPDRKPFGMCREWNFGRYKSISKPELKRCKAFDFIHMRGLHHFHCEEGEAIDTCMGVIAELSGCLSVVEPR